MGGGWGNNLYIYMYIYSKKVNAIVSLLVHLIWGVPIHFQKGGAGIVYSHWQFPCKMYLL